MILVRYVVRAFIWLSRDFEIDPNDDYVPERWYDINIGPLSLGLMIVGRTRFPGKDAWASCKEVT